ncbi:pterin-4-alpha-carbinolamine dehydratase [Aspergillus nomiae NRRL 13137]|uniref:4a-hydroxytetrahydrobiopterin dehydratase n=1 Tax=Aspergillus nomiae NRRL (strain ATCC 15546 / NRRL 13137 / CBS 260.88 / M93) TaxID=1509407 RepID=A0A0L1J9Q6_ASPN3|nr:pterin-4-alpha-carbinolamine dehydratase [Aspergillus nomiae NRRL 13137]KNG88442.1 pterin-4-alpha-carbinolamine dehydratase [Aspergillus nomiae NRRL 13137]
MNTVSRALQRPSRSLTSQLRRSTRQHHHRPFLSPVATSHQTLRSASPSLLRHPATPSQAHRTFSHSATAMAAAPKFARGVDGTQLQPELDSLLGQGWTLDEDGMGVKKTYYFKTYFKAVSFVNVVASQSATKKHHPTITVRIGSVDVHWTTHQPRGLTDKDLTMAQHCDEAAELMGAVEKEQGKKCGPSSPTPSSPGV